MAMTREEYIAKRQIMERLSKEGYPTYASLLDLFDFNLTNDPNVVGYMIPDKAVIVVNRNLDIDQVSTIVRHEILHEYLAHQLRMQRHLGIEAYDNRDATLHQLINIAGDYEISNRGYTEKDKEVSRAIKLNGEILKGLVTEDDHPEWVDWTLEEMFDALYKQYQEDKKAMEELIKQLSKIMNQGGSEIQDLEQIEREANDISDQIQSDGSLAPTSQPGDSSDDKKDGDGQPGGPGGPTKDGDGKKSSGDGSDKELEGDPSKNAEKASKIAKAAKKTKKEIEDSKKGTNDDQPLDTPEEQAKKIKIAKRVEQIKKAFDELKDKIESEDTIHLERDRAIKADKALKAYKADPIHRFEASLKDFIKKQVEVAKSNSWARPNRRYGGTSIIAPGKATKPRPIPIINVYFDQSGSWSEDDIQLGKKAINVLVDYVKKGKIKINLYYFSNSVCSTAQQARRQGGTEGQPILNHIIATRPDNVIVMTDSDISDCRTMVRVPGAVWFLWKDGYRSDNLMKHLKGERLTQSFDIKYK